MTELVIAIPDELAQALRRRSEEAGYSDLGAYLASKLREALDEPGPAEPLTRDDRHALG